MAEARHSSYSMTARYSHSRFYDLAAVVRALPIPTASPGPQPQVLAATGTEGRQFPLAQTLVRNRLFREIS
jgi:hypothetical protein